MKTKILSILALTVSCSSYAFDLEDYATTMRATRDAMQKAQLDIAHSKNSFDDLKNLLAANCYQVNDSSNFSLSNLDGLMTGTCNKDGQKADPAGGVLVTAGTKKLGTVLSRIIELTPAPVAVRYGDIRILGVMGDVNSTLMSQRNTEYDTRVSDMQAVTVTVTAKSGCTKTNNSIAAALAKGATLNDFADKYKILRDQLNSRINELKLATPAFIAARSAYRTASMVYVKSLGCQANILSHRWRYDPFIMDRDDSMSGLTSRK